MKTFTTLAAAAALAISGFAAHAGGLAAPEVEAESFETAEAAPAAFGGLASGGALALVAALVLVAALAGGGGGGGGGDGTK